MPPRLNKRQLREQEELLDLQDAVEDGSEEESPVAPSSKPQLGGFAALMSGQNDDDNDESEEETQTRSSKSKKARELFPFAPAPPVAVLLQPAHEAPSSPAGPSKKERKALKKQKAKDKAKEDEMDDVDKALAELSVKYPDLKQQLVSSAAGPASSPVSARDLAALLAVSVQHLDSEAELRKFFGSKVISAAKVSSSNPHTPARQSAAKRSNLTRPQPDWWPAQFREGLSVQVLTEDDMEGSLKRHLRQPVHGEKVWTVEYSKKYRAVTFDFMRTVMSGDPDGFYHILRLLPYHADTLLQLSEVYHHREEHSTAADYVDRALFTYERAFVGAFNFTSGSNRLDFDRIENRPFFLALHRQISDLQRRGCVRTSFEFARLLYALDPWTDPHGALLHLDYLAIKTNMGQWLIDLWDVFESEIKKEAKDGKSPYVRRMLPNLLPGIAYSRALALFIREGDMDHERSTEALKEAIHTFPSVVPLLADKADITLGGNIRQHPSFRIQVDRSSLLSDSLAILHLLSRLYANRAGALWKSSDRASWFSKTVAVTYTALPSSSPAPPKAFSARFDAPALSAAVYRHVLVTEASSRSLFTFLPRAVLDGRALACDPLPPPTRTTEYDGNFFRGVEELLAARPRSRRQEARMLERLVPDGAFRAQLLGFWDAHPTVQQRFPGGVVQFAQWAGQMPEEALEDLFVEIENQPLQEGGEMPGGMPGGEFMVDFVDPGDVEEAAEEGGVQLRRPAEAVAEEDDEEEEEEEEEEEVAALSVRLLRNVFNRFWGGGQATREDSSDEEEQLRDTGGVD
ncbi:transcriptional repressor TCF25-domain-containing protein [Epithele typhae]|uniref:transcriptional repressor TCF25-domain-containing protein n=1 Tax=Epithele typhae TaxID=378194 RepID=UPI002008AB06|nr:transcriptional repressor TCF25-domain-containing protein [Epithele typhae]KAH9936840.1 transcriptional repressor TCF25-domain-containing protein [Epithele typhae]